METDNTVALSAREVSLLAKMAILPIKIMRALPPEVLTEIVAKLFSEGKIAPEDLPTPEEQKEIDELGVKLGLPPDNCLMN